LSSKKNIRSARKGVITSAEEIPQKPPTEKQEMSSLESSGKIKRAKSFSSEGDLKKSISKKSTSTTQGEVPFVLVEDAVPSSVSPSTSQRSKAKKKTRGGNVDTAQKRKKTKRTLSGGVIRTKVVKNESLPEKEEKEKKKRKERGKRGEERKEKR